MQLLRARRNRTANQPQPHSPNRHQPSTHSLSFESGQGSGRCMPLRHVNNIRGTPRKQRHSYSSQNRHPCSSLSKRTTRALDMPVTCPCLFFSSSSHSINPSIGLNSRCCSFRHLLDGIPSSPRRFSIGWPGLVPTHRFYRPGMGGHPYFCLSDVPTSEAHGLNTPFYFNFCFILWVPIYGRLTLLLLLPDG